MSSPENHEIAGNEAETKPALSFVLGQEESSLIREQRFGFGMSEPTFPAVLGPAGRILSEILPGGFESSRELEPQIRTAGKGNEAPLLLAQLPAAGIGKGTEKIEGPIKRDAAGLVTEIKYPDDGVRKFSRDKDGQLVRIEHPDGVVHEKGQDGKWKFVSGKYLYEDQIPIEAEVGVDGTYSFSNAKGEKIELSPTGDSKKVFEGATVYSNAKGEAHRVEYKNGRVLSFERDQNGLKIIDSGKEFRVWSDEIQVWEPTQLKYRLTGIFSPSLSKDGIFSAIHKNGDMESIGRDGVKRIEQSNKATLEFDLKGQISRIRTAGEEASGQGRAFEYDQIGRISKYIAGDKIYERRSDGSLAGPDEQLLKFPKLESDGTLTYEDGRGRIHIEFSNGRSLVTDKTAAELDRIVNSLKNVVSDPDFSKMKAEIQALSVADRVILADRFRTQFGMTLNDELRSFNDPQKLDSLSQIHDLLSVSMLKYIVEKKLSAPDVDKGLAAIDDFRMRALKLGLSVEEIRTAQDRLSKDLQEGSRDEVKRDPALRLERGLTNDVPTLQSLGNKYGLSYESKTGKAGVVNHYYVVDSGGLRIPILDTRSENPREIDRQLRAWQSSKIASLEGKFNLTVSTDGQKDGELELQTPLIHELLALEQGLSRSRPSSQRNGSAPVIVQFLKERDSQNNKAYVSKKDNGQLLVRFQPRLVDLESLRGTVLHEWGHISEENVDARVFENFAEKIGFRKVQLKDQEGKEISQWQLKGKDGYYYAQLGRKSSFDDWFRVDESGRALKLDGQPANSAESREAVRYTNDEMKVNAAVTPVSDYFPNPSEALAETLKHLRDGVHSRSRLYQNGLANYAAGKEFDQAEIDKVYGKNPDGTSTHIRLPDSSIVGNFSQNRLLVQSFERRLEFEHQRLLQSRRSRKPK